MLDLSWESVTGAAYKVEVSSDLISWTVHTEQVTSQGTVTNFSIPADAASQLFVRITSVAP